jgi:hypothetical protein
MLASMLPRWRGCCRFWSVDDPGFFEHSHLDCDRLHRHAQGMQDLVLLVQESLGRDPFAGDVFVLARIAAASVPR